VTVTVFGKVVQQLLTARRMLVFFQREDDQHLVSAHRFSLRTGLAKQSLGFSLPGAIIAPGKRYA